FEALVRWHHPERGLVPPATFIPVAEETGVIVAIGWWVLREACRQLRAWQMQYPGNEHLTVSVNLSAKQFNQPHLVERIEEILQETGLEAACLKLELTESVIMENPNATDLLNELNARNIKLYIDDFGTGYSSLGYLHRFPIDTLKIDRSFISRMSLQHEKAEIVSTIIRLARNLGMNVVAEGVETEEQLAQLKELQCQYGQGYLFSKPVDTAAIETMLAEKPP
ncbi:MAG: EAL domain-containing protein, partial [Armatimonadota bacterium]|nr:EAL domain-containing protein [Armatimonadota bacterium]